MRYVAVDMGSTNTKRALVDPEQMTVADLVRLPPPLASTFAPGQHETNADAYFDHVRSLIDEALAYAPDCAGILFSSQMHGCVVSDADGKPYTGFISWQDALGMQPMDARGTYVDALARALEGLAGDPDYVRVGRKLAIGNLFARVAQGNVYPDNALFHTLGSYIAFRLDGAHVCHVSQAAATGCATARGLRWNHVALEAAGISHLCFPSIVAGSAPIGAYRFQGRDYPIFPDIGDHQAGALGSLARVDRDAQVNIGTGGMMGRLTRDFSRGDGYETRPLLDDLFIRTVTGIPGGRHLHVIIKFLRDTAMELSGQDISESRVWSWASAIEPVRDAPVLHPDFFHEGGAIEQIRAANLAPQALVFAMYSAIGEACSRALAVLGGAEELVYTGHAVTNNAALRQTIEKACGIGGSRSSIHEGTILGLMRLSLYSLGVSLDASCSRLSPK